MESEQKVDKKKENSCCACFVGAIDIFLELCDCLIVLNCFSCSDSED